MISDMRKAEIKFKRSIDSVSTCIDIALRSELQKRQYAPQVMNPPKGRLLDPIGLERIICDAGILT